MGCDLPGKYRVALDSDALEFGGHGRVTNSCYLLFFPFAVEERIVLLSGLVSCNIIWNLSS